VAGTAIGALAVPSTSLIHATGLDLVFPGFFLVLLVDALAGRPRIVPVAIAAAAGAAAACRFLPTGIALLLASAAVVLTLLPPRPSTAAPEVAR
jgi:predicted branched-subunit amino acid permease